MRIPLSILLCLAGSACIAAKAATPLPAGDWCSASGQAVVVPPCAVVVPPVGGVDPVGRLLRATVRYPNTSSVATLANVPMTDWTVFGRGKTSDPVSPPWGQPGTAPAIFGYPGNGYVSWCFVAPSAAQLSVGVSTYYGWRVDYSWSHAVGDFHPANAAMCTGMAGGGETFKKMSTAPGWAGCPFSIGETVCLNTRLHVPQAATATVAFNMGILKH